MDAWLLLDSGQCDYAFNMAMDDALLDDAPRLGKPVLRFYSWQQRAASFGYFQSIHQIEDATRLRPLVRRPTGGGLVPHDADWTYSVTIPPAHAWYALRATESYERVHAWIQRSFASLNFETELAACCRKELPSQCFAGHEKSDVLRLGRKFAGAAQRRTKNGLLIQGSIQPPPVNIARGDWQLAMQSTLKASWTNFVPDAPLLQHTHELCAQKYSRDDYNRRR